MEERERNALEQTVTVGQRKDMPSTRLLQWEKGRYMPCYSETKGEICPGPECYSGRKREICPDQTVTNCYQTVTVEERESYALEQTVTNREIERYALHQTFK